MNLGDVNFGSAAILTYVGYALKDIPRRLMDFFIERFSLRIMVSSNDYYIYGKFCECLIGLKGANIIRNNMKIDYNSNETVTFNKIAYGSYTFFLDKFTIAFASVTQRDKGQSDMDFASIRMIGLHQKKYKDYILEKISEKEDENSLKVYSGDSLISIITKRKFNTIFFKEKKILIQYLNAFKNNIDMYHSFGYQAKTGILLYGNPGTGKSSIAKTIASYMGWRLNIINVSKYIGKSSRGITLEDALMGITSETIVLFEDIDTCIRSRENDNKENSVLCTLLNFLDGSLSPDKVIFVATTNYIDRLDPALIRSGRFDLKIELKDLDKELAIEMCNRYNAPLSILDNESFPINPAYLQNKVFTYVKDNNFKNVDSKEVEFDNSNEDIEPDINKEKIVAMKGKSFKNAYGYSK